MTPLPLANEGLSFLGVAMVDPIVARVRIDDRIDALGPDDSTASGVAVMDDFIYGELHSAKSTTCP